MADFSSVVKVGGELSQYLNALENNWRLYLDAVKAKLEEQITEIEGLEKDLSVVLKQKTELEEKLPTVSRSGFQFKFFRKKTENLSPENESTKSDYRKNLNEVNKRFEELSRQYAKKRETKKAGETYKTLRDKLTHLDSRLKDLSERLEERHQKMTLLMKPIEDYDDAGWKKVLDDYRRTKGERDSTIADLDNHIAFSGYVMEEKSVEEATRKAAEIMKSYRSQYTTEILGKNYFAYCPVIELFEDFGSLLPNRIDMEDIITGNEQVEGYKAARNFLTIAQLDYSFFQQPSSRILKQKIENLNHTLTLNFQDFWQQSIGHNNKIKIQFEIGRASCRERV
jgi:hypothetical protein